MIKVTLRAMPTNYTSNYTRTFNSLEDAIRTTRKMDIIVVAMEEEGVGFHKVPLTKEGAVGFGPLSYGTPTGGKMHYSKEYEKAEELINEENKNPKLA
jgi:hypothetical protein